MDGRKKTLNKNCHTLLQYTSISLIAFLGSQAAYAQEDPAERTKDGTEIIEVTGTYQALSDAAAMKRHASQIVDAISASDIGKLPDTNIAEALQRVTGVTINRDDVGDGTGFQIRGFSANALTINGKSVVTDGFDNRENNLNALSSSLVKALKVSKSPTADQIEGGSGGSVEIVTFSPFDFEGREMRAQAEMVNSSASGTDMGGKFGGFYSDRIEIDNKFGELGYLINLETEKKNTVSQGFDGQYHGTSNKNRMAVKLLESTGHVDAPGHPAFTPRQFQFQDKDFTVETQTISGVLQWAPSDRINVELKASVSDREDEVNDSRLWYDFFRLNGNGGRGEFGPTLLPGATWHTLTRDTVDSEFDPATLADNYVLDGYTYGNRFLTAEPAQGQVSRSMLTSGVFFADSTNRNQNSPIRSMARLASTEKTQTNISLDFDWQITDDLRMESSYATSESETDRPQREMHLHVQTLHPETGMPLYPSLGYDIREGNDIPSITPMWLQTIDDADGKTIDAEVIPNFNPDYLDPAQRNDLLRLARLNSNLHRTRADSKEWRMDFDWDVDFAGITRVEFGHRHDELHNFKDRSDMQTPYKPGFVDDDGDGLPDDLDGDGIPDEASRRGTWPNRTLTSLVEDPLVDGGEDGETFSTVTYEQLDDFFALREGLQDLSGDFPRQYWVGQGDKAKWDDFINAVYGGHELVYEDLQTEKMTEKTDAFYVKLNFEYKVAGMPLEGNVGLRHVTTEGEGETYLAHCNMPWNVDQEKSAVVRAEKVAFDQAQLEWNDGGQVGEPPAPLTYSYYDSALSKNQGRDALCNKLVELGGDRVPTIFQEPFNISDTYPARALLTTGTGATDGVSLHKDWLWSEYDYSFTLPSLNLALGVSDNMVVRFAAYKTMARPGANDLSMDPAGNRFGNPNLKPFETRSMDLSWEWYMSETDSLSIAYFTKDLVNQKVEETRWDPISSQIIRQPVNGGDGNLDGIELSTVHTFDYLSEALQGFGVQANYTYVHSEQGVQRDTVTGEELLLQGRSNSTYNLQFFYEKNAWSARIAYNWRDERLTGFRGGDWDWSIASITEAESNAAGQPVYQNYTAVRASEWTEAYAQLDFSLGYKFSDKLGVLFKASNVNQEAQRTYVWLDNATRRHNLAATFYRLSVNWKL